MTTKTRPEFTLGDRLRKARDEAGLSQSEMKLLMRKDASTLSRWENGGTIPDSWNIERWAEVTGVDLDWLDPEHDIRSK